MAISGVKANKDLIDKFQRLKLKKEFGYFLIRIKDDQFQIFEEGEKNNDSEAFITALTKQKECCYGIYDGNKVALFAWNPDSANPKSKMLLASSVEGKKSDTCTFSLALASALEGIHGSINVTDEADLRDKLKQKKLI